jgi:hypothetical protein
MGGENSLAPKFNRAGGTDTLREFDSLSRPFGTSIPCCLDETPTTTRQQQQINRDNRKNKPKKK